jgi:hypothetical protein
MKTFGLRVTTQTLWDQTREVADCFEDAVERLHQYLVAQEILLADESHWPLLGARGRPTKNWYTWALANDHAVLYKIMDSRSNAAAAELLRDFSGTLMTDGYVVYTSKSKSLGFKQAHCWSHGRRKFLEAEDSAPEIAGQILDEIGQLFGIERTIAEQVRGLPADEANKRRAEIRDEQSRRIVEELGRQMAQVKALPKSPIAKAIRYYENRWAGMTRFLDDPRIAMTTNAAERALRATVLGRKNSLGSRSERGIEVAEVSYTLIGSCKLNGIDPEALPPRRHRASPRRPNRPSASRNWMIAAFRGNAQAGAPVNRCSGEHVRIAKKSWYDHSSASALATRSRHILRTRPTDDVLSFVIVSATGHGGIPESGVQRATSVHYVAQAAMIISRSKSTGAGAVRRSPTPDAFPRA